MKKILLAVVLSVMGVVFAQEQKGLSLADAREQIGEAAVNPAVMAATVKQLSAADQKRFVNEVNAAISKIPGTPEEKAQLYLNANREALKNAKKGNLSTLIAEVFATVPPEYLTVISEVFANELFNRASNPAVTYTDTRYEQIAKEVMDVVNERVVPVDNPAVRSTLALLMFVRASNGTPADLSDKLVLTLPKEAQKEAKEEWIPAALGQDQEQSYDPMMIAAGVEVQQEIYRCLRVAGPQEAESLLADLTGDNVSLITTSMTATPVIDAVTSPLWNQLPNLGAGDPAQNSAVVLRPTQISREPGGYQWQMR